MFRPITAPSSSCQTKKSQLPTLTLVVDATRRVVFLCFMPTDASIQLQCLLNIRRINGSTIGPGQQCCCYQRADQENDYGIALAGLSP